MNRMTHDFGNDTPQDTNKENDNDVYYNDPGNDDANKVYYNARGMMMQMKYILTLGG